MPVTFNSSGQLSNQKAETKTVRGFQHDKPPYVWKLNHIHSNLQDALEN